MGVLTTIYVNGIRFDYEFNLGDVVLTYDGALAQVREIDSVGASIKLNNGYWADPYELVLVRWLGYRANEVMKGRGKSKV